MLLSVRSFLLRLSKHGVPLIMNVWELILILAAFAGHSALWVSAFNNLHARRMPLWSVGMTTAVCYFALVSIPIAYVAWYLAGGAPLADVLSRQGICLATAYLTVCWIGLGVTVILRIIRIENRRAVPMRSHNIERHDILKNLGSRYDGPGWVAAIARLPVNQALDLWVHDMELELAHLPPELDGMSIAHLSDFHLTGDIGKAYFEDVIARTLEMKPDLIAITGDLVDKTHCLDWIDDTFGRLHAPAGVYYILGNHDERVDVSELHRRLEGNGLIHIGSRWQEITVREHPILIAGNELPWFVPAADLENAPAKNAKGQPLRMLLSHSPDQFYWAQTHQVDLMLAGHTHGGQFRFPLLGAVVSPCREGTRFAIGTYYRPPTVMHVSRGLSGTTPVRFGCPPELTRIVLRSPT